MNALEFWARYWSDWVSATFLKGYLELSAKPADSIERRRISDCCWTNV